MNANKIERKQINSLRNLMAKNNDCEITAGSGIHKNHIYDIKSDPMPTVFTIETVLGCNLKCPECAIGGGLIKRKKGVMKFDDFKLAFDKIKPYCQYLYAHSWGEPTLNPDIGKIIKYAARSTRVNISTNAVNLNEEKIVDLILSGTSDIIVSIDGVTQEIYGKYRVKGDVFKALNNLKKIKEINFKNGEKVNIIPQFIVFSHNQKEMDLFREFCESINLKPFFKSPYIRNEQYVKESNIKLYQRARYETISELNAAMANCPAPREEMVILLDGTVVVCCNDYNGVTNMGNIFEQNVYEIWNSEKYYQFRKKIKNGNAPEYCHQYCMVYSLKEKVAKKSFEGSKVKKETDKNLNFLQVNIFYPDVIKNLYSRMPNLKNKLFVMQNREIIKDGFNGIHMYASYMKKYGYNSSFIVANNQYAQRQWLKENLQIDKTDGIAFQTLIKTQIETIKPDILYLDDPIFFDGNFIAKLKYRPKLVMGWRTANIPNSTNWNGFDLILSNLDAIRDMALTLGAKKAEDFYPGFPEWIYKNVKSIMPKYDVVFCGQINNSVHYKRTKLLDAVAKASIESKSFSCAFFLSGDPESMTPALKEVNKGSRYGIEMHQALRLGKICIDARGDIGLIDDFGRSEINLAGKQTSNMRIFEATGTGVMVISEYAENLFKYFQIGSEIESFLNANDLIEKIIYYVNNPDKRDAIAKRGNEKCLHIHSMDLRCKALDSIIRRELNFHI